MTVGFLSTEKKENGEEGKKHLADFIPAPTPARKKKLFGTACCLGVIGALCLVAFAIGLTLIFVLTKEGSPKRTNIECDGDCNAKYECGYHGRRSCGDYDEDYSNGDDDNVPRTQHVGGEFPEYNQWIERKDNVYFVEISTGCRRNSDVKFVTMDLNTGYTAIKTEMRDGHGLRCMLFDNVAILKDRYDSVYSYEVDVDADTFDLHVDTILTGFYKYGQPVPKEREYLGESINNMCGEELPFYYMIDGEQSFRSQVSDLMSAYDVMYEDIFNFFVDIYVALTDVDAFKLYDTLGQWDEIIGFLPDGSYTQTSSTGVGWSLNIESSTWYHYDVTEATFSWSGTLVPQVADDDNEGSGIEPDDDAADDEDESEWAEWTEWN